MRCQVTAMGGLEAVITAKKWTEVSQPFHFPTSFTSKSFTLRKMYTRLLHDYEQVYFHRNTGPPTLPPGAKSYSDSSHCCVLLSSAVPLQLTSVLELSFPLTGHGGVSLNKGCRISHIYDLLV